MLHGIPNNDSRGSPLIFIFFSEHTYSGMLLHKWSKRIKVCLDTAYFVEIEKLLLKVL